MSLFSEEQARRYWEEFNRTYYEYLPTNKFDELRRQLLKYEFPACDIEATYRDFNYLSTFREEIVLEYLPELKTDRSIRTLLLNPTVPAAFLVFYNCAPTLPPLDLDAPNNLSQIQVFTKQGFRNAPLINKEDRVGHGFGLESTLAVDVSDFYDKIVRYTKTVVGGPVGSIEAANEDEVEKEIDLWLGELRDVEDKNSRELNRLQRLMEQHKPLHIDQKELDKIDEKLLWSNILKHFREGHSDKT